MVEKQFKELMGKQLDLLNFHKKQFEQVLSSELDSSYLPENVKLLLNGGLQGIKNYLAMLDSVNQRNLALQKENLPKKLQAFEARIDNCENQLTYAEEKTRKLLNALDLPPAQRRSAMSTPRRSNSVEPNILPEQPPSPNLNQSINDLREEQERKIRHSQQDRRQPQQISTDRNPTQPPILPGHQRVFSNNPTNQISARQPSSPRFDQQEQSSAPDKSSGGPVNQAQYVSQNTPSRY